MIEHLRNRFNSAYSKESEARVLEELQQRAKQSASFRISETPIFLPLSFKDQLRSTCESILAQIKHFSKESLEQAIPEELKVPNCNSFSHFLAIDFAICQNKKGELEPQLIELQGFPSLLSFQYELTGAYERTYPFLKSLEKSTDVEDPLALLKSVLLGPHDPREVVLLEMYPENQKTNIDFALTQKHFGFPTICITKVKKEGKNLFYESKGEKIPIRRIYNRVIFDELAKHKGLPLEFQFQEELDVEWVTHPNWFFMISKILLPRLRDRYIPKSYFARDFPSHESLSDFVLKPLYSFAGAGVNLTPSPADLLEIRDPENYILQKKVTYADLFKDLDGGFSKAEIRLLYLCPSQEERPVLWDTLVRMTKSPMAGMSFAKKEDSWIGSSAAFFEP
ncbi:hypothetical protein ACX3PU_05105 [Chryseobacterium sp. A301]